MDFGQFDIDIGTAGCEYLVSSFPLLFLPFNIVYMISTIIILRSSVISTEFLAGFIFNPISHLRKPNHLLNRETEDRFSGHNRDAMMHVTQWISSDSSLFWALQTTRLQKYIHHFYSFYSFTAFPRSSRHVPTYLSLPRLSSPRRVLV